MEITPMPDSVSRPELEEKVARALWDYDEQRDAEWSQNKGTHPWEAVPWERADELDHEEMRAKARAVLAAIDQVRDGEDERAWLLRAENERLMREVGAERLLLKEARAENERLRDSDPTCMPELYKEIDRQAYNINDLQARNGELVAENERLREWLAAVRLEYDARGECADAKRMRDYADLALTTTDRLKDRALAPHPPTETSETCGICGYRGCVNELHRASRLRTDG